MPTNDDLAPYIAALAPGVAVTPEEMFRNAPDLLAELRHQAADASPTTVPPGADPDATVSPSPTADADRGDAPPGYEIFHELGRGGMGVVYRARQVALNRVVALKMILSGGHAGPEERQRFLAEAEAIAKVKHPGIVQVFDFGTHDGLPFFSLELCEGGSLADRLREGPLPPREAAVLVEQIARAVQAAHDAGIIHRDLKPGNVLLALDGSPRVTDFGLAKRAEGGGNTQTGAAVGTPSYMAPEQAEGKKTVGPPADVWALGAVLYACLTGRPPFQAATTMDTLLQVVADEPVPVRRLNGNVPADLETVCHKSLQKDLGRRYSSAATLADDLKRWLEGRPITARPVGRVEQMWSWCRREPVTASLLSTVALVLLAATGIAWGLASWALGEKGRADFEAGEKGKEATAARKAEKDAKDNEELAKKRQEAAEFQAFRAEDARHSIQMDLIRRSWEDHQIGRAEQLLADVLPRFRETWETLHARDICRRKALPLKGSDGEVTCVAFSPDGRHVVGDFGNTLKVWDTRTGRVELTPKGHADRVTAVAFSPDGKLIASGASDGSLKVWDPQTGETRLALGGHEIKGPGGILRLPGVTGVVFSADGLRIVSGGGRDATVRVWDARTGKEMAAFGGHGRGVTGVAISTDGGLIAAGCRHGALKLWDTQTGKEKLTFDADPGVAAALLQGIQRHVRISVAFSPDGKRIASGSNSDDKLRVWDARAGGELLSFRGHLGGVSSVAFSPDGKRIASAGRIDSTVRVWDADTGREMFALFGPPVRGMGLVFSPDGKRIASGGVVAVSLDNVVASNEQTLRVWEPDAAQEVRSLKGHPRDAGKVASAPDEPPHINEDVKLLRLLDWESVTGLKPQATSPDGNRIVSGDAGGYLVVWDAKTVKEVLPLKGHTGTLRCVAYSPDGRRIVSGSADRTLRVWDADTGREQFVLKRHWDEITCVAYSPDGRHIVSGGKDGMLVLWDADTGQEKLMLRGHTDWLVEVAFSPDGRHIVSGSKDGTIKIWGTGVTTLEWHEGQARRNEEYKQPFAAAFHLERLHRLRPRDADVLRRLQAALKSDAPGIDLIRERHRAFTAALPFLRAAALVGTPPLALPALLP